MATVYRKLSTEKPLFGQRWSGGRVNAYPSSVVRGPDGIYHVAVVWRAGSDVSQNFRVSYARSHDLSTWTDGQDRPIALPITPDTIEVIDRVGTGEGLLNNIPLAVDRQGRPVIGYMRYDEHGDNQVYWARFDGGHWVIRRMTDWRGRWEVEGTGSLRARAGLQPIIALENDRLAQVVTHWSEGRSRLVVEAATLSVVEIESPSPALPGHLMRRSLPLADGDVRIMPLEGESGPGDIAGVVRWETQGTNNDRPRSCTPEQPVACDPPPSPLQLFVFRRQP